MYRQQGLQEQNTVKALDARTPFEMLLILLQHSYASEE